MKDLEKIKELLKFYADPARYNHWTLTKDQPDHWVFDATTWGSVSCHQQPPKELNEKPWSCAQVALQLLEANSK